MDATVPIVILPRGKRVVLFTPPTEWTVGQEFHGYVDPSEIAADLDQPREHMDEVELQSLTESVSEVGVKENLTITPRTEAPWVRVSPTDEQKCYVAVSGHRRTRAALRAGVRGVPVTILVYESAGEYLEDADLLNNNRSDLQELEEGRNIVRLLQQPGNTEVRVAKMKGMSVGTLQSRVALTKLPADLQALLDPRLPKKKRLASTVGSALGKLGVPSDNYLRECLDDQSRFDVAGMSDQEKISAFQRYLSEEIMALGLTAQRAKDHIEAAARASNPTTGIGSRAVRREPRKQLEIFTNFVRQLEGARVLSWNKEELRRAFDSNDGEVVKNFISRLEIFQERGGVIKSWLSDISKELESRIIEPEAELRTVIQKSSNEPLDDKPLIEIPAGPIPNDLKDKVPLLTGENTFRRFPVDTSALSVQKKRVQFPIECEIFDYGPPPRYKTKLVQTPIEYYRIWNQGNFAWQRKELKKPDEYPEIKEIEEMMNTR